MKLQNLLTMLGLIASLSLIGMEKESPAIIQMLSDQTHALFKAAFEDFGIPQEQIKVDVIIREKAGYAGQAFPKDNKIIFELGRDEDQDEVEFGVYHEVAHCADKKLRAFEQVALPLSAGGATISTIALTGAGFKAWDYFWNKFSFSHKSTLYAAGGTFLASGLISIYLTLWISRKLHGEFEHRANREACSKLLRKNKYNGIANYLALLKGTEYFTPQSRTCSEHPLVTQEFARISSYLHEQGYEVAVEKSSCQVNVIISKEGKVISTYSATGCK